MSVAQEPRAPDKIGRYEIRRELGRGMMGVVYEAHDPALGRSVALKTIRLAFSVSESERRSFEERFLTEARVAARLSDPGIVVVHDVGQDADTGTLYIAIEYLRGQTLADRTADGKPLEWREALGIVRRLAEALHHAHLEGVIHRDVKPANIMILPSGQPKILDFGIAKIEASQLTATGQFFGTPLYMSPEQVLGKKLDSRSDLFSLGALAYGLLTGQQAFGGVGVPHIITRVLSEDPAPPTQAVPGLPPDVDYLIARALAKEPNDRYPSGLVLAEDIGDVLAGRPPRHRPEWLAPGRAEGTMASRPADDERAAISPAPAARPAASAAGQPAIPPKAATPVRIAHPHAAVAVPRRTEPPPAAVPWKGLAVAAALLLAGVAGFALRGSAPAVAPSPPAAKGYPATPRDPRATPRAATAVEPPEGEPPPTAPPKPRANPGRDQPARLAIDFGHDLRSGRLRVWVDDDLVVEERLDSRVTRTIGQIRFRKGTVEETLALDPGQHEIKVQVSWDDNVKVERISGNFSPGDTRRLAVKLAGVGGLGIGVRRKLSLAWE